MSSMTELEDWRFVSVEVHRRTIKSRVLREVVIDEWCIETWQGFVDYLYDLWDEETDLALPYSGVNFGYPQSFHATPEGGFKFYHSPWRHDYRLHIVTSGVSLAYTYCKLGGVEDIGPDLLADAVKSSTVEENPYLDASYLVCRRLRDRWDAFDVKPKSREMLEHALAIGVPSGFIDDLVGKIGKYFVWWDPGAKCWRIGETTLRRST